MNTVTDLNRVDLDALLNSEYELIYIDYRDSLDMQTIKDCLDKNSLEPIYETIDWWTWDARMRSINYLLENDIKDRLITSGLSSTEADAYIESNREALEDAILERDVSNPATELLRNTTNPACFITLESYDLSSDGDVDYNLPIIKRVLGIDDDRYDEQLSIMIQQAWSSELVVYFQLDLDDLEDLFVGKSITFHDPYIALIDNWNGAGDHTQLKGLTLTVPYEPGDIYIDRLIKYSYSFDVCGLSDGYWEINYEVNS